ncbi:MAG TPA: 50S ribosomal protein L3 [Verrucomicrobiae bacterium]|nr:50S ribosomal protein L3 [Verrucomicrobiae bacterium]
MPLGLLGKKLGHTRVYDANGVITPVTVVLAGPNRVLQVKTQAGKDGYNAVQLGFDEQKEQRLAKPLLGHIKKFNGAAVKRIKEFRDFSKEVKPGDVVGPNLFAPGDFVDAYGVTKGRGFEGVVKRHRFAGGDSTHGAKGWHRRSGAIGQRLFPGTVMRGMKMPGHMGNVRRTTQNLEVIQVREADNLLLIKGSIPGAEGDYVVIRESKKRPKGWKPQAATAGGKKGGAKK